jgi:Gene product 88
LLLATVDEEMLGCTIDDVRRVIEEPMKASGDSKVSAKVRRESRKYTAKVFNTVGLFPGLSCPGATALCLSVCYALAIASRYKDSGRLLLHNTRQVLAAGDDVERLVRLLRPLIVRFRRESQRHGTPLLYRLHWAGDFVSLAYALAWAQIIAENPDIDFWGYTRSFLEDMDVVPLLDGLENLTLYLSVDRENVGAARRVLTARPHMRVSTLGADPVEAQNLLGLLGRGRAPMCPENVGRMPLVVTPDRRMRRPEVGEHGVGACAACRMCVDGVRDVGFSISKKGR